jgi:hypothetical protein
MLVAFTFLFFLIFLPNVTIEWLALVSLVREVPGSNLCRKSCYPGFPKSLQQTPGYYLKLGDDRFSSQLFRRIVIIIQRYMSY